MAYEHEKEVAVEAVGQAAELCEMVRTEMVQVEALQKADDSPVTVADFGGQALVCRRLAEFFPHDPIVAEEDSSRLCSEHTAKLAQVAEYVRRFRPGAAEETICQWIDRGNDRVAARYWTLDPIDGTKGFLRHDQYAVALALVEEGQVQVAALACPTLPLAVGRPDGPVGVLFVAVRGAGAEMALLGSDDFEPIHVGQEANTGQLRFTEGMEPGHSNRPLQQAVARALGITRPSLRLDGQAKYGVVARGEAALYLRLPSLANPDRPERIWDHAAGSLLVEEAGGRVTDKHGRPLDFASSYLMRQNRGVIVSNGLLHDQLLAVVADKEG